VLKLEMNAEARAKVRVAIGDRVGQGMTNGAPALRIVIVSEGTAGWMTATALSRFMRRGADIPGRLRAEIG
jgi:hypothetical protein